VSNVNSSLNIILSRDGNCRIAPSAVHALERTVGYNTVMPRKAPSPSRRGRNPVEDLKDIRPTLAVYCPRVLEKLYEGVMGQLANAPATRKALFGAAMGVGRKALPYILSNRSIPFHWTGIPVFDKLILFETAQGSRPRPHDNHWNRRRAPFRRDQRVFPDHRRRNTPGLWTHETTPITHLHTYKYIKRSSWTCGPAFPRTECKSRDDARS